MKKELESMLYPVIDIGSNTVKIAVLDEETLFREAPVFFKAVPLKIKSKIVENNLPDCAIEELAELIKSFSEIGKRLTCASPIAFATASLRGIENLTDVLEKVKEKSGVEIRVISGKTEAYYSFLGAKGSVSVKNGISVDLGGGSTEILSFRKTRVLASTSLPFGCLTLYQNFFENGKNDMEGCRAFIREHLKKSSPRSSGNSLLLSGGSAKAILRYKNILENKKNFTLQKSHFLKIEEHFNSDLVKEKEKIEEVLKDRFRLVPPALAVFSEIADHYKQEQVLVCRSGVREGCLYHYLNKKNKK
ncbi:MAG: hypothetical protein IKU24_00065 [Clostridia bacterium]|nr:hypothetical protein [Clostridia bacterium]